MRYDYANLHPGQFEELVVCICQLLLGAGVQGFAVGPDGGRDAKFVGTAQLLPSKSEPWVGTTIVQAKHTIGNGKTFSDAEFFAPDRDSSVVAKEVPRIQRLRTNGAIDNYILFSNRRLSGIAESKIRAHLSAECGIPESSIMICGIEQIELWLKRFPEAALMAEIDPLDSPLLVSPDDIADVVEALSNHVSAVDIAVPAPPDRVMYRRKNELNGMSEEFAGDIRRRYLKESHVVSNFLADPGNEIFLRKYQSAVDEFQTSVMAKRGQHQSFDALFEHLLKLLWDRDPVLRAHKKLTSIVLFYMYWSCDLGRAENSEPVEADAQAI